MRTHRVALLTGDGIGPVLAREADDLLALLGHRFGFCCETALLPFGREAFTAFGTPLPDETAKGIRSADAAFAAAVDAKGVTGPTPVGLLRKNWISLPMCAPSGPAPAAGLCGRTWTWSSYARSHRASCPTAISMRAAANG